MDDKQALHFKWRPKTFDEVIGNPEAVAVASSILERDYMAIPRTWLFTGESGTGKTTMVRIIKDMLECSDADFHEFDSGTTRGIDTIREVKRASRLGAMDGTVKIYFFDEFHKATKDAKSACLKMFEDAPSNTFFFIATTNPEQLPKEIRTRCTNVKMKTLTSKVISAYLKEIVEGEGIEGYPSKLLSAIAKASQGSCREAVKCLDQVIDIEDDEIALNSIESYTASDADVADLCKALLAPNSKWATIAGILKGMDGDAEGTRLVILNWFTKVLLSKDDERVAAMIDNFRDNYYDSGKAGLTVDCYACYKLI